MKKIILLFIMIFIYVPNVLALTGTVNVNDALTLRDAPTTKGKVVTSFYNGTELNIIDTNAGSGNGCSGNWYKVSYGNYTGYSCGSYIVLNDEEEIANIEDDTYNRNNYNTAPSKDGTIMCYGDTSSLGIRETANGNRTGKVVDCGEEVNIIDIVETKGTTCPYWYKIERGSDKGYICGYYVNTTKLSKTALAYYNSDTNDDTIEGYKNVLIEKGFPESYHSYLLEIHARHPKWKFVAEELSMDFDAAVNEESIQNRNVLQGTAFNEGWRSIASHTYNMWNNTFMEAKISDPGYYNASREAIAYYMDPRNYLNEKYIFAFETLEYVSEQREVVSSLTSGQSFFNDIYKKGFTDGTGSASGDIIKASSEVGISSVHVAARIRQEMGTSLTINDSRLGGNFTYNGKTKNGYYNFFNIKCSSCTYEYAGYAFQKAWDTPYKGIYGGASFLYNGFISVNQDTLYYEKFDVSTNDGHYTHQYMQNLAVAPQETNLTYNRFIDYGVTNYFDSDITFVIPVYKNMPLYAVTAPKLGSNNNYLKNIKVNGNNINNFSYNTYNYNVYLDKNTTSVDIGVESITNVKSVNGIGKIEIKEDNQTNKIEVISKSGKKRTYTIEFIREATEGAKLEDVMNNSGFKYNDNYLFGIEIGTNVSQLIGNISNFNHTIEVIIKDKDGNIKTNDSFRTGDVVNIKASDGEKQYKVLIYGDIDSDGLISKKDLLAVQSNVFGFTKLDDLKKDASDINKDGIVDKKDLLAIQSHVFGFSQIKQS